MPWIYDLIKHLGISKIFATAVFITSYVLLFGHSHFPSQIPAMKDEWKLFAVGAMAFSGIYLVCWIGQCIVVLSKHTVDNALFWWNSKKLDEVDNAFILAIAMRPDGILDLYNLRYDNDVLTRIEMIQKAKLLKKMGLVNVYNLNEHIVSLTERGKVLAAKLQSSIRASKNT